MRLRQSQSSSCVNGNVPRESAVITKQPDVAFTLSLADNVMPKHWNPQAGTMTTLEKGVHAIGKGFHDTWTEFHLRAPSSTLITSTQDLHTSSATASDSSGNRTPMSCNGSDDGTIGRPTNANSVVTLENADKTYGKGTESKKVLEGLNMSVQKGIIYGLLGASGCGKTTVLSCIVGRRHIDHGRIQVFGGIPGDRATGVPGKRVGYMPQELALYTEFTIEETLDYFGRIYGMKRSLVKEQIDFLLGFLDLPEKDRLIRTLSGGQQRRVSFAVSLLHNPELLILDEPTVGVDPMLRKSIWSHLVSLVQEQHKTIIITTHYIEEARQAHVVGLMRHGRLLAEDAPQALLDKHSMPTLEDVFLKLCIRDKTSSSFVVNTLTETLKSSFRKRLHGQVRNGVTSTLGRRKTEVSGGLVYPGVTASAEDASIQPISYAQKLPEAELSEFQKIKRRFSLKAPSKASRTRPSCYQFSVPSPFKVWALMMKNFIKLWRNLGQLLFIFLLPAIQVVFFCVAIGREPTNLKIAVVNNEIQFGDNCTYLDTCEFSNLSCRLFESVFSQPALEQVNFPDWESAMAAVEEGSAWAAVETPANFSHNFLSRLWKSVDAEPEVLNQSSIFVRLDNSNQQVSFVLQRNFRDGYRNFFGELLSDCGFPNETSDLPLIIGDPVYGPEEANFTDFMAPGIIILIIFFLALALTGELFITEKRDGLLDRSWIAGVLPSEVLIAHVVTQFLILIGQSAITLIFILLVFSIPCEGPVGWLIGLTLLQGTAGMCYGLLLSALFSDLATSMQMSIGSFYPNLLLSGILWPVEGMPGYLKTIAWYLPCTAACQAMRDVMSRGWDMARPSVYLGYISTSAWIAVFLLLSWITIKIKAN